MRVEAKVEVVCDGCGQERAEEAGATERGWRYVVLEARADVVHFGPSCVPLVAAALAPSGEGAGGGPAAPEARPRVDIDGTAEALGRILRNVLTVDEVPGVSRIAVKAMLDLGWAPANGARCPVCGLAGQGCSTSVRGERTTRTYGRCAHVVSWASAQDLELDGP